MYRCNLQLQTHKKGESNTHSLAAYQVLGGSCYPRGGQRYWKGFHPLDHMAAGAAREPTSLRQLRKLKSKLCFATAEVWGEICPLKVCHQEWLTSSCSRIPLEPVVENTFTAQAVWCFEACSEEADGICGASLLGCYVTASLLRVQCFLTGQVLYSDVKN